MQTIDEYVALMDSVRPAQVDHMDEVESSSLRRSGVLLRELAGLRAALERDSAWAEALSEGSAPESGAPTARPLALGIDRNTPDSASGRPSTGRRVRRGVTG